MNPQNKVALIILDGLGLSEKIDGNAVKAAYMPCFDKLWENNLHSTLSAKGLDVGLPSEQMGNSEVGHLNIGAGRIVYQSLTQIGESIKSGDFFLNPTLIESMRQAKENNTALHLVGLISHGGVHSDIKHLFALLEMAQQQGLKEVYIHGFLDGRDTAPQVALYDITELQCFIDSLGIGAIASLSGRFYGMDRDQNWARTKKAYDAMVFGKGEVSLTAKAAIQTAYEENQTDEFITPRVIVDKTGDPVTTIKSTDTVIIFNFRPDRARQIARALGDEHFDQFENIPPLHCPVTTMTQYHKDFTFPIAFQKINLKNILGAVLEKNKILQLRAAETEKYAHVTFFFNAMREEPFNKELRILTPSVKVDSYDLAPEMSANDLTDSVIDSLDNNEIEFLLLNYANPDMVGHSGSFEAVVKSLEILDKCLNKLVEKLKEQDFNILITADHGNAEQMIDENGSICKTHTFSPVPFIFVPSLSKFKENWDIHDGILADLAPTVLYLFNIPQPTEMTGVSLIRSL